MGDAVDAVLFTYEAPIKRFGSRSERNRFYRGLHGYTRTVRKNDRVYRYEKDGLLGETPHIKVADSVFIVADDDAARFKEYFREWGNRVTVTRLRITLKDGTQLRDTDHD